jgi:hypothetical protein
VVKIDDLYKGRDITMHAFELGGGTRLVVLGTRAVALSFLQ